MSTMTFEDFFTLTEMKDGLTAPARVEELVAVMQKDIDGVMKNAGDMTRQVAAVANAIAATENKECLDLFIQLDGLWYIDRWLKDAQTFGNETNASFVEEAVSALLLAVEKLQIDNERLVSSGICATVKGLLTYKSSIVQDKARALFDCWKVEVDLEKMDVEKAAVSDDTKQISEHLEIQSIVKDASLSGTPADQTSEGVDKENVKLVDDQDGSQIALDPSNVKDTVILPVKVDSVVDDLSTKELMCSSDGKLDSQLLSSPKQDTSDGKSEKCDLVGEEARHEKELGSFPDSAAKAEVSSSCPADGGDISSGFVTGAGEKTLNQTDASTSDGNEGLVVKSDGNEELVVKSDGNKPVGQSSNDLDDGKSLDPKVLDQSNCSALVEIKDLQSVISALEEACKDDGAKQHHNSKKKRFGKSSKFSKLTKNRKNTDIIRQTADMDLEDGNFDALEVARLVANEVEREIGDYEEHSGSSSSSSSSSSSENISTGGIEQPDSPGSTKKGENQQVDGPINEVQKTGDLSLKASEKTPMISCSTIETNLDNHVQDIELSQVTDVAREPDNNTEKLLLEFDLNQEFSSDDIDQNQGDMISNPVSVVSASRAVVSLGVPAGPLKFEGSLGWKGSAATSAFRPASPRRASDSDRALSGGGTSSGSRQRQDFLDIDLNVAEGGDDRMVHLMSTKQKQLFPGLPSGESSVELSPKRSERLKFDLNLIEEDGNVPVSQWKMGGCTFSPMKNCQRSPSPASSSSCMQSATRNFDLNDNPSNGNDAVQMHSFLGESSSNKVNPYAAHQDDSVISILGAKVKKSTFPSQNPLPFPNGKVSGSLMDASLFRGGPVRGLGPAVPYAPSIYGYNGLAMGPAAPFSAPVYGAAGPIPYMLDTRGAPFVPQLVGAPYAASASYGQPSLNFMGVTPAPNVAGPLRPNVDLNSGYAVEMGNRDPNFFRQLFIPGQGRPLDDQLRDNFRPLSSGASGGKRKEPDTGWELYPTNYKHQQPPHL